MPVIKKYENRRLYDTSASRYVNLDDIARMVQDDAELVVTDVKSGRDLTAEILLQIVTETGDDAAVLPPALLRRIIRTRGDEPLRRMLREQLLLGLELLDAQLGQSESYMAGFYAAAEAPLVVRDSAEAPPYRTGPPVPPFGMHAGAIPPTPIPDHAEPSPELPADPAWRADPVGAEELDALREELTRLEARLKR